MSVYGLGYQQGIIDDVRNPKEAQQSLLDNVLASVGVYDARHVHIVTTTGTSSNSNNSTGTILKTLFPKQHQASKANYKNAVMDRNGKRVALIGSNIIRVAKLYVQEKLQTTASDLLLTLPSDMTEAQFADALLQNDEFLKWHDAYTHLGGYDDDDDHGKNASSSSWSYYLLETSIPNAFVSELLPKRIFVTIAMLDIIENDDELALILGHEIAHLLLGHVSERNIFETVLRTMEVLLLSIDPTEGIISLFFMAGLVGLRQLCTADLSRDHEREADALGIALAAMACYDTRRAVTVMQRLQTLETHPEQLTKFRVLTSLMDSHPPTEERFRELTLQSETVNAESYQHHCANLKQRMNKAAMFRK